MKVEKEQLISPFARHLRRSGIAFNFNKSKSEDSAATTRQSAKSSSPEEQILHHKIPVQVVSSNVYIDRFD